MKSLLKLAIFFGFLIISNLTFSQSMEGYFYCKGVRHLSQAAHASNDYLSGTYNIQDNYIDISIKSRDNITGFTMQTDIRVVKEVGKLYFSDLIVIKDTEYVKAFTAFGFQIDFVKTVFNSLDPETYRQMRLEVNKNFNTDFEHWNGKMWALLAINTEYYEYLIKGNCD